MTVEHLFYAKSKCPVNGQDDTYTCTIRVARMVKVEEILALVAGFEGKRIFQEDLTEELARALGAEVHTVGWHSGVRTTVLVGTVA